MVFGRVLVVFGFVLVVFWVGFLDVRSVFWTVFWSFFVFFWMCLAFLVFFGLKLTIHFDGSDEEAIWEVPQR